MRMFAKLGGVTGTSIGLTITVRFTYEDSIRLIITSYCFSNFCQVNAKLKCALKNNHFDYQEQSNTTTTAKTKTIKIEIFHVITNSVL